MTQHKHAYSHGQHVAWQWGQGIAKGDVAEIHTRRVTQRIKGATVTRNATPENPAYTVVQHKGPRMTRVLKSHSELHETN